MTLHTRLLGLNFHRALGLLAHILVLLAPAMLLAQSIPPPPTGCLASYASEVVSFHQGQRKNGGNVPPSASDPAQALGRPSDNPNRRFVSLGFGGELVLGFEVPLINIPGSDDFVLEETTPPGQNDCSTTPEKARVEASQDLTTWVNLGEVCLTEALDLGSLAWASYLRITDISDVTDSRFQPSDDGFDVNGVEGIGCPAPPVVPLLECVTDDFDKDGNQDTDGLGDPIYTARFGYNNEGSAAASIPIGSLNKFSPSPADRGQPATFEPGLNQDAFHVQFSGAEITWTLKYPVADSFYTASASSNSLACPLPPAEPEPVRPVLECVRTYGDGTYTARFGFQNDNDRAVEIPVGSSSLGTNTFTPGQDQGQPVFFEPGRQYGVFDVTTSARTLVWSLGYSGTGVRTATASAESKQCSGLTPTRRCVFQGADGSFRAIFGYKNEEPWNVRLEVSPLNSFVRRPRNRGQPTLFTPGTHPTEFSALLDDDENSIVWRLDGKRRSASILRRRQRCVPPPNIECTINPPISAVCAGAETQVKLSGNVFYSPVPNYLAPQIEYVWDIDCNDPAATVSATDTLTPSITLRAPGSESSPGSGVGTDALCTARLVGTIGDPLVERARCATTVSVAPCITDCAGLPGGPGVPDQCGVCNGDNSTCAGCDDVPNSGLEFDECGVCGGDGTSCQFDCAGVQGGSAVFDRCGVCGGDGNSCLACVAFSLTDEQIEMDQAALNQRNLVFQSGALLRKYDSSSSANAKAQASEARADELYFANWTAIWRIDSTGKVCENDTLCTQDDTNSKLMKEYNSNADELQDLGKELVDLATDAPALRRRSLRVLIKEAFERSLKASSKVPPVTSSCD